MQSLFFLITTMFQIRINKKITFNKHLARKYIRAYTNTKNAPQATFITPPESVHPLHSLMPLPKIGSLLGQRLGRLSKSMSRARPHNLT